MPRSPNSLALCALGLLAASCVYEATSVQVVVDTDVPLRRLMHLVATVSRAGSAQGNMRLWNRGAGAPDAISLPASFAIVPRDDGPRDEAVTLVLEARVEAGGPDEPPVVLRRTARFRMVPRQTTRVAIYLPLVCGQTTAGCSRAAASACTLGALCEERGMTCGDRGTCVSPDVTPEPVARDAALAESAPADLGAPDTSALDAPTFDAPTFDAPARDVPAPPPDAVTPPADAPAGCGACPSAPHATGVCTDAGCAIACDPGFADCDGSAATGCETPLGTSANCRACGDACTGGRACSAGGCACVGGAALCAGTCADLASDPNNCGACGARCTSPPACNGGYCAPANDTCATAFALSLATPTPGTTCGARLDGSGCGGAGGDTYYVFTPSVFGAYLYHVDPAGAFTVGHIGSTCTGFAGTCGNDVSSAAAAGFPHYVIVQSTSASCGAYTLTVTML